MERIYLVTGAAGHLGGAIVRSLLRQGRQVRALILPDEKPAAAGAVYIRGDVTRPETLESLFARGPGQELYLIHAAGLVDITGGLSDRLIAVNVGGTRHMLALSRKHRVERFVYVSSVHAIPEPPGGGLVTETDRFSPRWVEGGYDVVDVRDAAEGCILAAERGRPGQCYILSGHYAGIGEILGLAAARCGRRCPPCPYRWRWPPNPSCGGWHWRRASAPSTPAIRWIPSAGTSAFLPGRPGPSWATPPAPPGRPFGIRWTGCKGTTAPPAFWNKTKIWAAWKGQLFLRLAMFSRNVYSYSHKHLWRLSAWGGSIEAYG